MDEDLQSWERQTGESNKAWAAFQVFRDLGGKRTITAAQEVLQRPIGYRRTLEEWSSRYNWVARCREYDQYIDRITRVQREQVKRDEYARKVEAYRDETERTAKAMVSMGARAIAIIQRELATRLQTPEVLKSNELAGLMRASVMAVDVGSKLQAESLGIDTLVDTLADEKNQR
ncbi:hypothetical protein HW132_02245 [Brasilonema sp. CT11]|nr:hypothetical protein [Brasilonema sp. CT11]